MRQRIMDSAGKLPLFGRIAMLKCGECTFFHELDAVGNNGIRCNHPEVIADAPHVCSYDSDCRYGYPDRGQPRCAARLIAIQTQTTALRAISSGLPEMIGSVIACACLNEFEERT